MIDDNALEGIMVLRSHLEEWEEIIRWAHGHFAALDLSDNYRMGRPNLKPSKITNRTANMLNRIAGYLNEDDDDE